MRPDGRPAQAPIAGRFFALGDRLFVVVAPLPTSLPIPLGVSAPAGIAMLTWAFAGLAVDDPTGPRVLLVLAADQALHGDLILATHYRDITVSLAGPEPADALSAEDLALLARAILSAVSPSMAEHLAGLVALIGNAGSTWETVADAPELVFETAEACTLGGAATPNYLLLRSGDAWALARVASARLEFGETPRALLALDMLWGAPASAPDAAIALHGHGFTPLRIGSIR